MQALIHRLLLLSTPQKVNKTVEPISMVLTHSSDESAASYSLFVEGKWCALTKRDRNLTFLKGKCIKEF